jgi:16S rRNA G527 N7-methylase RsmG
VRELALVDVVVIDERFEKIAERSPARTADLVTARALRADVVFSIRLVVYLGGWRTALIHDDRHRERALCLVLNGQETAN